MAYQVYSSGRSKISPTLGFSQEQLQDLGSEGHEAARLNHSCPSFLRVAGGEEEDGWNLR